MRILCGPDSIRGYNHVHPDMIITFYFKQHTETICLRTKIEMLISSVYIMCIKTQNTDVHLIEMEDFQFNENIHSVLFSPFYSC